MSINKLNNFDQLLKSKIDNHEVAFNENDWIRLQDKLLGKKSKPFYKSIWLWSGAATISLLIVSTFLFQNEEKHLTSEKMINNDPVVKNSSENNNNHTDIIIENENLIKNNTIDNTTNKQVKENTIINNESGDLLNETTETETTASNNHKAEIDKDSDKLLDSKNNLSPTVSPEQFNATISIPKPEAQIFCKNQELCVGNVFNFETLDQSNVDYLWSFGDEKYSKNQNPEHKYDAPGPYIVSLIVRSKIDNSILTKSKEILVHVIDLPKVNFESEEKLDQGIPVLSFINTTDKALKWSWNLGDGNISEEKDPSHNYRRKGYYNVSLTATNKEGCVNTISKKIFIENDYNLLAPNSFTPNGDGINDFFIPEALKVMDVEFSMSIFSQTQGLLFESKNINQQWDGNNQQTGEKCAEGNYIWVVTLSNNKGQTEQYKGAVLILE